MTVVRRVLLLVALMFWQGGSMFYGAVVVPVGSEVLGSHAAQARVTRPVTNYLNAAGAAALAAWGWDLGSGRGVPPAGRRTRWLLWGLLAATLAVLAWLHLRLDGLMSPEPLGILDRPTFHALHRAYLLVSTVQWLAAVALTVLTVQAWRRADAA